MLEVRGLRKSYGEVDVLRGVDLEIARGQILGLLGANGAGKTTMISIVAGLQPAGAGTVTVAGVDALRDRRAAAPHIGLAPQQIGYYPTLTVRDNLAFFARLAGLKGGVARQRVEEVAELLSLHQKLRQRAEELSGGQKRRLHTGIALLHRPDLLFLDEPTVGADVSSRREILGLVRAMAAEGSAVVYTTHYLSEIEDLGAEIAVLHEGRIAVTGTVEEVLSRYSASSVALRFDGPAPSLPGWRVEGATLVPAGEVADPGGAAARALAELGEGTARLIGVGITRPHLDSAFLAITGTDPNEEAPDALVA